MPCAEQDKAEEYYYEQQSKNEQRFALSSQSYKAGMTAVVIF